MPTIRKFANKNITPWPETLGEDIPYEMPHTVEDNGQIRLIMGKLQDGHYTTSLYHGFIGDENILRLQIIFAYGIATKMQMQRGIMKLMQLRPMFDRNELAAHLLCSNEFLPELFNIPIYIMASGHYRVPFSNLIGCKKLDKLINGGEMAKWLCMAKSLPVNEFIPKVYERLKEVRLAARSKKRK